MIVIKLIILWLIIGFGIAVWYAHWKIPGIHKFTKEELKDFMFDVKIGPIGPIVFIYYLIIKWIRNE